MKVKALLQSVDAALDPALARSLNGPARATDTKAVAKSVFGGKLPADLGDWFAWHDGQRGIAPLDPKNNFTAMTAKSALETWRFLHDPDEDCIHPKPTWLPLFHNGAGDYLMYETADKQRGALFTYWHDDSDWPRAPAYKSLADWATRVAKAHANTKRAPKRKPTLDPSALRFEKIGRAPTLAALAKIDVGTMFRVVYHASWVGLRLKATSDVWLSGGGETYEDALDDLELELSRLKRSEMTCDASEVQDNLKTLDPKQRATLSRAWCEIELTAARSGARTRR